MTYITTYTLDIARDLRYDIYGQKGFHMQIYLPILALMSALTFFLYGIDKRRARCARRRIPERTLFFFAALGGATGALLGMRLFRHKTRHIYFYFINGFFLLLQLALLALLAFQAF